MTEALIAPFPYFGGKSKVADIVWQALGRPKHYIEPFFGSGAVLLNRPNYDPQKHTETIVDAISPGNRKPGAFKPLCPLRNHLIPLQIQIIFDDNKNDRSNIMYYIIETNYVGPNRTQDQYVDVDRIDISTSPAMTNLSHVVRTEGWCGTTNGWSVYAHGEYGTIDAARAAIAERFGDVRNSDADGDSFYSDDADVVETYKRGKYAPMSSQATADWAYEGIQSDIEADTSDERIAQLVAEYEAEANRHGFTLDSDLEDFMQERRQELRDELEDDA